MRPSRLAWGVVCLALACTPRNAPPASGGDVQPAIDSIAPTSGQAGPAYPIRVTVYGSGFAETGNVVRFGPVDVRDRPSTDGGTRIVFSAPKVRPTGTEAPPPALMPGTYDITVTTPEGTSNVVRFTLTSTP
ncbi:MAG: hypothetical protein RJQ04_15510 [Longimicrobiales bacterium]